MGRVQRFAPEPRSVGLARRFVADALTDAGRRQWVDVAELLVSEMVTNAVLHAHTDIDVVIAVGEETARLEVHDRSPALPAQRSYDVHATTGRGLGLVAMLSRSSGVEVLQGGKSVWCVIADDPDDADLLAAFTDVDDVSELDDGPPASPGAVWRVDRDDDEPSPAAATPAHEPPAPAPAPMPRVVQLQNLPTVLRAAAQQHDDALLREYVLWRSLQPDAADTGDGGAAPDGSPTLDSAAADRAHALLADAVQLGIATALASGVPVASLPSGHRAPAPRLPAVVDVAVTVGPEQRGWFTSLQDVLDSADSLAARDLLLVRPALPEIVALRDWCCDQVVAQLSGVAATPWPGTAQERFTAVSGAERAQPVWDETLLSTTSRAVVAADDFNRIVGISAAASELLGWPVDDLVGRRVVTIIPPELREAHVAGFTRHLTTGVAHALGVDLELPVLHRDGRTMMCRFLVEAAPAAAGRSVYLAWLSLLPGAGAAGTGA